MKNWPAVPTERWRGRVGNFEFNEALNEWDFTPLQKAYLKSVAALPLSTLLTHAVTAFRRVLCIL